jgi:hypothetical protein
MFKIVLLSSVMLATVAASAAQAAPSKPGVEDERTLDRWVEIFHPEELVGPEIDPDNPLYIHDVVEFDPQPEPPRVQEVVIIAVKR